MINSHGGLFRTLRVRGGLWLGRFRVRVCVVTAFLIVFSIRRRGFVPGLLLVVGNLNPRIRFGLHH